MHPFAIYMISANFIALIPNVILMILIFTSTPPKNKDFAILLINQTISHIIICIVQMLLCEGFLPAGQSVLISIYGPAKEFSAEVNYHLFALMLSTVHHSVFSTALPFVHRLRIVQNKKNTTTLIVTICIATRIPYVIEHVGLYYLMRNAENIPSLYASEYNPLDRDVAIYGLNLDGALFIIFFAQGGLTILSGIVFYAKWKVNKILNGNRYIASETTKRMHRRLIKAFTIQSNVPALMALSVTVVVLGYFKIYRHWSFEYICMGVGPIIIFIQPLISIEFISFYKNALFTFFGVKQRSSNTRLKSLTSQTHI